jgi:hypothetical protein
VRVGLKKEVLYQAFATEPGDAAPFGLQMRLDALAGQVTDDSTFISSSSCEYEAALRGRRLAAATRAAQRLAAAGRRCRATTGVSPSC